MKLSSSLLILLLAGEVSYASSLSVYRDNAFYSFSPENNFIGFAQNVSATCQDNTIALSEMTECPEKNRLCHLLNGLEDLEKNQVETQANLKVLAQLTTLPQPSTFDATAWIDAAKLTANEEARLTIQTKKLSNQIQIQQYNFNRQAPRRIGLKMINTCSEDIKLTIPNRIHFSTHYEANIEDKDEIEVTQYLSVTNSSGIDIKADSADFYYRSAFQYINPIQFNPWIVSKYTPRAKKMRKHTIAKAKSPMNIAMFAEEGVGGDIAPVAPVASYEDAREYKIEKLDLPSSGVPIDVKLLTWKTDLLCEIKAYPYVNTRAFQVCSFHPKYQIDSNSWKIKSSDIVLNENAVGEYRDNTYHLYTKVEEDIQIQRTPIVKKERETGIFGGNIRKKDGFFITLTNKSNKEKKLTIIDHIPTSTTEEIKSKLLSIKSEKNVNYKLRKNGKIEINVTLAAQESKKIEILFEISYDKDLKVNY